jgi:hypothetical protein
MQKIKKIMINQSNYIPWKGYIDSIALVDEFVIYDCVQYTKNDWRNRNKIKTPNGTEWITIPIQKNFGQKINEAVVSKDSWSKKHLRMLESNYKKSHHFNKVFPVLESWYKEIEEEPHLSKINTFFLKKILKTLSINTTLLQSEDLVMKGDRNERLLNICRQRKAKNYLSGPAAEHYLDINLFNRNNIVVSWLDYSGYNEYPQLWSGFNHEVSIFDMFFNLGIERSKENLKYVNK